MFKLFQQSRQQELRAYYEKRFITFQFSKNMFSFSKWVSEWAFIFKMWFFFERCFHFQNVKGFIGFWFFFLFPGSWKLEKMEGSDFCDPSHENWRKLKCLIFAKFHENSRRWRVFWKFINWELFGGTQSFTKSLWHAVIYKFPVARGHLQIPCGTGSFTNSLWHVVIFGRWKYSEMAWQVSPYR